MKSLDKAKQTYLETPIPPELNDMVHKSIQTAKQKPRRKNRIKHWGIGIAAASALFIGSVNISPALAQSLAAVPALHTLIEVITVQDLKLEKENSSIQITTPNVSGLENKELEEMLNTKYIAENQTLYDKFIQETGTDSQGNVNISTDFQVLTNTEDILSITRYQSIAYGSSQLIMRTDNIDKKHEILITLPSLFKDDSYIETISAYIIGEMQKQMEMDNQIVYWIASEEEVGFEQIRLDQNFFITENHKLTISFDKYEVAPGSAGIVSFEIPTEIIEDQLVSDYYIK